MTVSQPSRWRAVAAFVTTMVIAAGLMLASSISASAASNNISGRHAGKCVDDTGFSKVLGTQMQDWTCNGLPTQSWHVVATDNSGDVRLQVAQSGLCLDMQGGSSNLGDPVIQWSCIDNDQASLWQLMRTDISPYFLYKNKASGTCMTVSADSTNNGAKIQGWTCTSITGGDTSYYWTQP